MEREEIDDVICEILYQDGPDRHIDGHDVLTNFIMALLADEGETWIAQYVSRKTRLRYLKQV